MAVKSMNKPCYLVSSKINCIFALLLILYTVCLTIYYMGQEHFLYYWDFMGYFSQWKHIISLYENDMAQAGRHLLKSMYNADYNCLPVMIPAFFGLLLGSGRTVFILSLVLCYLLPLAFVVGHLVETIFRTEKQSQTFALCAAWLCILLPGLWGPTLRGYPGVSGLLVMTLAMLIVLKNDLSGRIRIREAILLGLCLWLMFAMRRWYAYTVVALYIMLPLLTLVLHTEREREREDNNYYQLFYSRLSLRTLRTVPAI